ncbi:zinc finger protein 84-like [Chrysoperla carnea]|uniref:zinc finger protein 84-like n=1 Tax=Chrysoperla carnea TaxID=189513 RepID=UPI001D086828|nr:zinc finger protein 84-like [Chrysoperla carnea]
MEMQCVLVSDFERVCRICMKFGHTFLPINSFKIIDMIIACASIQIWENDGLPNQVCNECFLQLQNTINFKQLCENSDNAFRQIIEQSKSSLWNNQNNLGNVKNEELDSVNYPVYIKEENDDETVQNKDDDNINLTQNNIGEMVEIKKEDKSELSRKRTRKKNIQYKYEEESDGYENLNDDDNDSNYDSENEKLSDLKEQLPQISEYECETCSKTFKKVDALGWHMKRTHNAKGVKCGRCSVVCYHSLHLRAHEKKHNKCRICNTSFSTRKKLVEHKLIQHKMTQEKRLKCEKCEETFQTKKILQKHVRKMHPKVKPPKAKRVDKARLQDVSCEVCGRTVRRRNLRSHMLTHRERDNLNCRYCAKVFTKPEELKDHMEVSHKKCVCDHCGLRLRSNQLKKHLLTHTKERPHACDKCDKTYRNGYELKSHISRVHLNERNFVCTFCSQAFFDKKILLNHVRRHTGEKPYKCQICEKAFIQSSALNVHMKMHANYI